MITEAEAVLLALAFETSACLNATAHSLYVDVPVSIATHHWCFKCRTCRFVHIHVDAKTGVVT